MKSEELTTDRLPQLARRRHLEMLLVATVEVDPPSGDVVVGQALQLTAVPKTEGGIILPARDVTWASTNNSNMVRISGWSARTMTPEGSCDGGGA